MMRPTSRGRFAARLATLTVGLVFGCTEDCPEFATIESAEYAIDGLVDQPNGVPSPSDEWLVTSLEGASMVVERTANQALVRYTRDGTTYEVRYTLVGVD